MKKLLLFLLFLIPLLLLAQFENTGVNETITKNSLLIQQFSQLAPLSINPYAAVFLTSLFAKIGIHNQYVASNPFFNSWIVLILFGTLFLFTSVVGTIISSNKVSAPIKKADEYLQNKAAILINGFIMLSPVLFSNDPSHDQIIYQAGFLSVSLKTTLIFLSTTYFLMVVMTVRYFIDLIIFLSPIPFIDSILEIVKIVFTTVLVGISILFPTFSAVLFGIMFLSSLLFYKRALLLIDKVKYIMIYPIFNFFRKRKTVLTDGESLSILVLLKNKFGKIGKGKIVRFEKKNDQYLLIKSRFLLPNTEEEISLNNCYLIQNHLDILLTDNKDIYIQLNRSYHKLINDIADELDIEIRKKSEIENTKKLRNMFNKEDISDLRTIVE